MKKKFDEIFLDCTKQGTKIKTDEYQTAGRYQIIDQGQKDIAGFSDRETGVFADVPAIVFGDHTRIIKYVDKPFFLGADGVKVLRSKSNDTNYKYLYYALQAVRIPDTGYNRHFKWLKEAEIKLPERSAQEKIAKILDAINGVIEIRQEQLHVLEELVKLRFQEMFGNHDLNNVQEDWKPISAIGTVVGGATPKTSVAEYWDGEYRWITPAELDNEAGYIFDSVRKLTELGVRSCSLKEMPIGTVILSSRAPIGKVAIAGNTFYCNQGFKNIICNEEIHPMFLYTLLRMNTEYLISLGRGATFKEITKSIVENIRIPVPRKETQEKFATFVQKVDELKFVVQKSIDETQLLFDSLMQKYFS